MAALGLALPAAAAANDPVSAFLNYTRPATYQAVVTDDIDVPLSNGSYLSCDLYRPGTSSSSPAPGRFPGVVYQYHDYGVNRTEIDPAQDEFLAEHGYNSLECSVPGDGGSPGTFEPLGPQEARDGYDIVEWLARQPWSNGKVAMVGYSFGALTAYLTAALRPPNLVTIVPQASYEDLYLDLAHLGGVQGMDVQGYLLGLILALNTTGTPPQQLPGIEQQGVLTNQEWGQHLLDDSFWQQYAINFAAIKQSAIPILGFGGWYDIYQRGMPANYQQLPHQTWLVMQNVAHIDTGPTFYGTASGPTLAWLDHWVMGLKSAPLPPTHIISYEMPASGGHGWTEFTTWPPPGVRPLELHMDSGLGYDGTLDAAAAPAGSVSYPVNPFDGMPTYWNVGDRPDSPEIIAWNTAREAQRVHFTTPVLTHDLVMTGEVQAHIKAAFSATDGILVVRLSDVAPDGADTLVATGWAQASLPPPYTHREAVTPGQPRFYNIQIWPSDWRFLAGHRLQISISSGDVPRIVPDAPAGNVTIYTGTGASSAAIPVLEPSPPVSALGPSPPRGCPAATGRLTATHLGPARLGRTRAQVRRAFASSSTSSTRGRATMVFFCLHGIGIRVGYLRGRAVLALTANRHYALRGVRPGARLTAVARRLNSGRGSRVGRNTWYLVALGRGRGVLKVQNGVVEEIGIADPRLVRTRAAARRFFTSFD
jgi:hypothetical protein